jgi:hypothetical protein
MQIATSGFFFFPVYDPYTRTIPQGTKCRSGISTVFSTVQVAFFFAAPQKNFVFFDVQLFVFVIA